jgi:alpha-ribazole phosphatase/probable phosphoglycerate mutase
VFSSDLVRAAETASVAFAGSAIPVLHDWRLRECDYGQRNGMPAAELHAGRREHLDQAHPGGESWQQAITRVGRFLGDLPLRWNGQRILVIGHVATRWGLDHFLGGVPLEISSSRTCPAGGMGVVAQLATGSRSGSQPAPYYSELPV